MAAVFRCSSLLGFVVFTYQSITDSFLFLFFFLIPPIPVFPLLLRSTFFTLLIPISVPFLAMLDGHFVCCSARPSCGE